MRPAAFWPEATERLRLQALVAARLNLFLDHIQKGRVSSELTPQALRARLAEFDFRVPIVAEDAVEAVLQLMSEGNVNMMHPGYLGLFNPSVAFPSILADLISSTINPQLAVWSHAPAAVEIESHVVKYVAKRVGWNGGQADGHFTTGGAEANYTALLVALTKQCSEFSNDGVRALSGAARIYVSAESHLAWFKIAHQVGIGRGAVRLVPTDGKGMLDVAQLDYIIQSDKGNGDVPILVVATAGTTNAGMIDPLVDCHEVARRQGLWFHIDAAWGGAAIFGTRLIPELSALHLSDSITIDAHKWLAVGMGAGIFLCRHTTVLGETFRVQASYMPPSIGEAVDPYTHSLQWSRRFIGLRLFFCLSILGEDGYRRHIDATLDRSMRLKELLRKLAGGL